MGKGDKRTKRGKIIAGSFGNSRKHKVKPVEPKAGKKKSQAKTKKTAKPLSRKKTTASAKKA